MTASEPPAKWGADSRVDDDVMCRVEEGRAAAARRGRRGNGNQGKEEWNSKWQMARPIRFQSSKQKTANIISQ